MGCGKWSQPLCWAVEIPGSWVSVKTQISVGYSGGPLYIHVAWFSLVGNIKAPGNNRALIAVKKKGKPRYDWHCLNFSRRPRPYAPLRAAFPEPAMCVVDIPIELANFNTMCLVWPFHSCHLLPHFFREKTTWKHPAIISATHRGPRHPNPSSHPQMLNSRWRLLWKHHESCPQKA